jgi:hypothetical protein
MLSPMLPARGEYCAECSRRILPRHRRAAGAFNALPTTADSHAARRCDAIKAGAFSALAQQTPRRRRAAGLPPGLPERSVHSSPCPSLELPLCPFLGSPALGCLPPTPCTSHTLLPQLNGLKHRNLAFLRSPISPQPHIDLVQPASVLEQEREEGWREKGRRWEEREGGRECCEQEGGRTGRAVGLGGEL